MRRRVQIKTIERATPRRPAKRRRPFTLNDPLFKLLGAACSEGPGDVSRNKQKYLAQVYHADEP